MRREHEVFFSLSSANQESNLICVFLHKKEEFVPDTSQCSPNVQKKRTFHTNKNNVWIFFAFFHIVSRDKSSLAVAKRRKEESKSRLEINCEQRKREEKREKKKKFFL